MPDEAPKPRRRSRWLVWIGGTVLFLVLAAFAALAWLARHAEPLLHDRVVNTLAARFHSPVELDNLQISLVHGLAVEGTGLRILYLAGPTKPDARQQPPPMLSIRSFQFHSGLRQLLEPSMRIVSATVQGAELRIPPAASRGPLMPDDPGRRGQPREGILVDSIVISDLNIVIENSIVGKPPLEFQIANLTLTDVGRTKPFAYDATLRNPKPVGDVRAVGHFGPWQNDNPRDTPLDGSYIFSHADLSTIKGIGGMLSSNGSYNGTLGQIKIDGVSDTPDFRLTISNHPMPLHASFHAIVDATTGDTYLQPVNAMLLHSPITANGSITRQKGVPGHDVELDVALSSARIEDLLALSVRTYPAMLRGELQAKAHISIPQGAVSVTRRMRLKGSFAVQQGIFTNVRLQQQVADLSERALGLPEKANAQQAAPITSTMKGTFALAEEQMDVTEMEYAIPGAAVRVDGRYGLDGAAMDFHGTVRTQATASEMVAGWKSLLLMPFDHLLKKNGAGLEVPFKLSGTQADPKLDLDFGHKTPPLPLPK